MTLVTICGHIYFAYNIAGEPIHSFALLYGEQKAARVIPLDNVRTTQTQCLSVIREQTDGDGSRREQIANEAR